MIKNWLSYIGILLCALAFRVAYTGWLAGVVLAFALILPPLGILLSVPAAVGAKVTLSAAPEQLDRGEEGGWTVNVHTAWGFPLARVRVRVEWVNRLTLERGRSVFRLTVPGSGARAGASGLCGRCGLEEGRITAAWAADCLGLFWLPVPRGPGAGRLVLPRAHPVEVQELPAQAHPGTRPRPGGGPGEDYDPRDYRPGDPINTIHWKLSAKRGSLIVRETLEELSVPPVLVFDHFGPPEAMDIVLERLRSLGEGLLKQGRPFAVAWAQADSGQRRRFEVADREGLRACLAGALSEPWPLTGRSVLDLAGMDQAVYLSPERGAAG